MKMRQRRRLRLRAGLDARPSSALRRASAMLDEMHDYYRLEGREVVRCSAIEHIWDTRNKGVHIEGGDTTINGVRVSTIFLGFDHNFNFLGGPATPILFETMTFADAEAVVPWVQLRYATYDEAEAGHAHICGLVREAQAALTTTQTDEPS